MTNRNPDHPALKPKAQAAIAGLLGTAAVALAANDHPYITASICFFLAFITLSLLSTEFEKIQTFGFSSWIRKLPGDQWIIIACTAYMIVLGVVPLTGVRLPQVVRLRPADESLPGFASQTLVRLEDANTLTRQYNYEYRTSDGAKAAFYLTASKNYAFAVTDINQETYTVDVPLGSDGIPFKKWIVLLCEVGTASNYSYLRVLVNGKEIARRDLNFPLQFLDRKWTISLGSDSEGKNGGAYYMVFFGAASTTFTDKEAYESAKQQEPYLGYKLEPFQ